MRIFRYLALLAMLACGVNVWAQHSVTLTWTPPAAKPGVTITGYNVYRATVSNGQIAGVGNLVPAGVAPPLTTFTDTGVAEGQTYFYKLTSWCPTCTTKESALSNEVKAVIPVTQTQPGAPTVITIIIN